jgi:hypothetical protein
MDPQIERVAVYLASLKERWGKGVSLELLKPWATTADPRKLVLTAWQTDDIRPLIIEFQCYACDLYWETLP